MFWASTCIVFVTWGLVPVQAGIFATETITQTSSAVFAKSINFMPASEQPDSINGRFIHSTHGIIWLNETLPPYMTRDYVLAPVKIQDTKTDVKGNETWTVDTTLYSLDMQCEFPAIRTKETTQISGLDRKPQSVKTSTYASSNGCEFPTDYYGTLGNDTIGPNDSFQNQSVYDTKEFSSIYIGYYSTSGSEYYLEGLCPKTSNHTFMVSQVPTFISIQMLRTLILALC